MHHKERISMKNILIIITFVLLYTSCTATDHLIECSDHGANEIDLHIQWGALKRKQRRSQSATLHYQAVIDSTEVKVSNIESH